MYVDVVQPISSTLGHSVASFSRYGSHPAGTAFQSISRVVVVCSDRSAVPPRPKAMSVPRVRAATMR
ncbi:hypothetical protein SRABI128_02299 [Microbacterium sp. Bi128]|nr:hypothetical protein SRABI128_02299 [Microbacterium sp. Bi128]